MNKQRSGYSLAAMFTLATAVSLSLISQIPAEETSVILDNGDTARIQGGGTEVEANSSGNVKVYVNGYGRVSVYTNNGVMVHPAFKKPEIGSKLEDDTIYIGGNFATTVADASTLYIWEAGKQYCESLTANGHDDWALPTRSNLNRLYQNKDKGALSGTFADTFNSTVGHGFEHWYWSSEEYIDVSDIMGGAWAQNFSDGVPDWNRKDVITHSVRCVRTTSFAP